MNALVQEQKKRIAAGEVTFDFLQVQISFRIFTVLLTLFLHVEQEINCYIDFLLSEGKTTLTEKQIGMLVWETIIETSDTTMVTTEWAMYELAKNPKCQVVSITNLHISSADTCLLNLVMTLSWNDRIGSIMKSKMSAGLRSLKRNTCPNFHT